MGSYHACRIWNDAISKYIGSCIIFWKLEYSASEHCLGEVSNVDQWSARNDGFKPLGYFLADEQVLVFGFIANVGSMDLSSS
jgi:hypothetical protein